jgi:hypothetical protein
MANDFFWSIVSEFNDLMKSSIEGPNCINPNICKGDCCSIKIDISKVLAKEYITRGYANKNDFIRSSVFSFCLRFDDKMGKCFLFDKTINGCKVHDSGIKPPQCWIYPTNFSNPKNKEIDCKRASGWKIIDSVKTREAEILLKKYVFLCELEAKKELKRIINRTGGGKLKKDLSGIAPSHLGGFRDTWNRFKTLPAEGVSLQLKKFCHKYNKDCEILSKNFLECSNICDKIADKLIDFLQYNIYNFIKCEGADTEGKYPFYKLFEFVKNNNN